MTIGERIRAVRKAVGLHQSQLAERAGTTQDYISDLELGKHEPGLRMIRRLARALGVRIGKLLD